MTGSVSEPALDYQWSALPAYPEKSDGWAHHGVAVTNDGHVVTFAASGDEVLIFDADGHRLDRWSSGLTEGHCISLSRDDDGEHIWIADPGTKMVTDSPGSYHAFTPGDRGRVVKFDLTGRLVLELPAPNHPAYDNSPFAPTAVVVDSAADGGTGNIWVSDGYGANLIHVYSPDGEFLRTLPNQFKCPHGLIIDRRRSEPELYVADRENQRLQVFGLDGQFRRMSGEGVLRRPSAFAISGENLIIAELEARLAVLNIDDELVGYIGADDEAASRPGWPNAISPDGLTVRPELQSGRFNSPHGVAATPDGKIIVAEWLIGGRLNQLKRAAD